MYRLGRRALAVALVALHATVMLCGPSLHGLPGLGHESGLACGPDAHHVRHAVPASYVQPDDCPVCHFFTQAHLPVDPACVPATPQVCALKPNTASVSVPWSRLHPTSPRAPPAAPARLS
jgi:hypothetical protein